MTDNTKPFAIVTCASAKDRYLLLQNGITDKEAASILGQSSHLSATGLYNKKIGVKTHATVDYDAMRDRREWRELMIPFAIERFERSYPTFAVRRMDGIVQNTQRPWSFSLVDAEVHDPTRAEDDWGVLKVVVTSKDDPRWAKGVPTEHLISVNKQMDDMGYACGYVCMIACDSPDVFSIYPVAYDPDLAGRIRTAVDSFWNVNVHDHIPPTTINLASDESSALLALHDTSSKKLLDVQDAEDVERVAFRLCADTTGLDDLKEYVVTHMLADTQHPEDNDANRKTFYDLLSQLPLCPQFRKNGTLDIDALIQARFRDIRDTTVALDNIEPAARARIEQMLDDVIPLYFDKTVQAWIGQLVAERDDVASQKNQLEARRKQIDQRLKTIIGDDLGITDGAIVLKWLRSKSQKFDEATFKQAYPAEYRQFATALDEARLKKERPDLYKAGMKPYVRDGGLRTSRARSN
jgi:hypothetical protein